MGLTFSSCSERSSYSKRQKIVVSCSTVGWFTGTMTVCVCEASTLPNRKRTVNRSFVPTSSILACSSIQSCLGCGESWSVYDSQQFACVPSSDVSPCEDSPSLSLCIAAPTCSHLVFYI